MSEWKEYKLKDITTKIGSGSTPTGGQDSYKTDGVSLIRSMNIYDFNFDYDGLAKLDDIQAQKLRNVIVEKEDILINITGASVGRCTIVPDDVLPARVNQHVSIIRVNDKISNSKFLLYSINSPFYKNQILGISDTGSTREALTKTDIEKITIKLPPLPTQQKIAHILGTYDELIEVNNERIKLLEETAQSLYKEWFVRFRFPNYQNTEFIKGVPKGWEIGTIGDVCKVGRGSSPRPITDSKYFKGGTIPWIKIADATASSKFVLETKEYVNEHGAAFSRYLKEGSLIIATSGTLGFCVILGVEGCIHDGWLYLSEYEKNIKPSYMFFAINTMTEYLNNLSYGAAIQNVNSDILRKTPFLIPDENILNLFYSKIEQIDELHKSLLLQNTELRQIRDRLLPRLISGKMEV